MHSKWVWSLKPDPTTSLWLNHTLIFLKSNPTWHMSNSLRVDPYAHPQLSKVLKHFVYIHGCGMQTVWVCSPNHDITTLLSLSPTPIFPRNPPPPAQG